MIIDGHNDLVLRLFRNERPHDVILEDAARAGFAGGFFALFVPSPSPLLDLRCAPYDVPLADAVPTAEAARVAARLLEIFRSLELRLARRAADFAEGRVTAILHLEGAEPIEPDLSNLARWHDDGLRSLGLVWSRANAFAEGVPFRFPASPDTGPGLTDAGRRLVHACARLGILVDLSHLNEAGFWDVARLGLAPLVASHSNAHALSASTRNLTDEQLDAVAASGGVVGINFAPGFLREDGANVPETPVAEIVRHVDYVARRIGVEHVAFGSDFDGAIMPAELGGLSGLPRLVALLRARYSDADVAKIAHENWLRVLDATWRPWRRYFAAAGTDPRPTLVDAASRFAHPGEAVDLGAGTGRDTAELLRRGWRVLAIDREEEALERLRALANGAEGRLETLRVRFEDAEWGRCDLVNASYALPFCSPVAFPGVWRRIVDSLRTGGRFAGQLLGPHDDWAGSGVLVHTRDELAELLAPFAVERLEEVDDDGTTAVGSRKHWHLYHVVARKM